MSLSAKCYGPLGLALLASASLLALSSGTVLAQEASTTKTKDNTIQLDPITVEGQAQQEAGDPTPPVYAGGQVATGGRAGILGNKDTLDTAINTSSYTEKLIKDQQADTIADVVDNDPGVVTSYSYGGSGDRYMIRGFVLDGDDVSLDGLYGTAPRQLVDVSMYDRVEVTKGASGFINGMSPGGSGIGGAINLVPKRATDTPITSLTTTYGMDSEVGTHLDVGRRFGKDNQFGIRANLKYSDGETSIDDEERETIAGALSFDYRGDDTRITIDSGHNEKNTDHGRTSITLNSALTAIPDAPSASHNFNADGTWADLQDDFVQGRIEHDFSENIMGYAAIGTRHMEESGIYSTSRIDGTDGTMSYSSSYIVRNDTTNTAMGGARVKFDTLDVSHELNIGASGMWNKSHQAWAFADGSTRYNGNIYGDTPSTYPPLGAPSGDLNDPTLRNTTTLSSLFIADTASFLDDRLHITAGIRHQTVQTETFELSDGSESANHKVDEDSPMVGVVANVTDQVSVYANYTEALSVGQTAPFSGVSNPGEQMDPYVSTQYEIGTKADFGTFGGSIALFQIEEPSAFVRNGIYVSDGTQRNRGLEFQMFGEPVAGTRILGGVTLYDAELTDLNNASDEGNTPIGVPDYIAKLGVEYDLPFIKGATVNARVIHTGSQYANTANTLEIPSWTRLDLGARYETEVGNYPVTMRANVENVTNNDYWASANGGYLTMGAPLTAKVSLTVDF
ncbi:TonB-dependent receptor [Thalassospira sp.]|uniref:TonB-dependent receptor n=1 Tax=Thalassospira sp. TaxID=1912094 RepID=UPI003AA8A0DD